MPNGQMAWAGATVVLAILAVALGIRLIWSRFIADLGAGLALQLGRPVTVGERIAAAGCEGVVRRLGLRATYVETDDRTLVAIPNAMLLAGPIGNLSRPGAVRRIEARVRIPLAADVRRVRHLLHQVFVDLPGLLVEPAPHVLAGEAGASALELVLAAAVGHGASSESVQTELRLRALDVLASAGIGQVHDQHDIHLRDLDMVKAAISRGIDKRREADASGGSPT